MTSSDNLLAYNWGGAPSCRSPAFPESFSISDLMRTTEADAIARALQSTFVPTQSADFFGSSEMLGMWMEGSSATPTTTITTTSNKFGGPATPSASGGSENDASVVTRGRVPTPPTGRVSKRKSRSTKRAMTTFFTADPASFRQMVQQITGVKGQVTAVMKPEPQRVMPTLDTSGFLVDGAAPFLGTGGIEQLLQQAQSSPAMDGSGLSTPALDFDSFCCFPTLESWKAI